MSRKSAILLWGMVCMAAAAVIIAVRPVQGAKPSPPLSLTASFEALWQDGSGQYIGTRIHNDLDGCVYANTPSTRKIVYGVDVTYTPAQGFFPGQFVMKIDRSGLLGRYVRLDFQEPSTDPA